MGLSQNGTSSKILFKGVKLKIFVLHPYFKKYTHMVGKMHKSVEMETETHDIRSGWAPNEVCTADCNRTAPEVSWLNW